MRQRAHVACFTGGTRQQQAPFGWQSGHGECLDEEMQTLLWVKTTEKADRWSPWRSDEGRQTVPHFIDLVQIDRVWDNLDALVGKQLREVFFFERCDSVEDVGAPKRWMGNQVPIQLFLSEV